MNSSGATATPEQPADDRLSCEIGMESFCPRRARHPRNSAHCAGCISSWQFVSPHHATTSNGFGHGDMYSGHVGTHACDTTSAKEAPAVNRGLVGNVGKAA